MVARGGPNSLIEKRHVRQDDSTVWTSENISLVRDAAGLPRSIVTICQDITDRRRAEEELHRAHVELERRVRERTAELAEANAALQGEVVERTRADEELRRANQALRRLIHASPLAIIALDGQGRVTIWNPAAERMFGWGDRDVLGRPLPSSRRTCERSSLRGWRPHSGEGSMRAMRRCLKKDGSTIEVSLWTAPLDDARGEPCGRMGVIEDITDRKRAEEARTALLRRIVTAQEEERLRIARELHDQMGQHLAALMLGLKATIDHIQDPAAAKEALQRLHDLANRIGQEVHRVSLELRPTALDDWGLQTGADELCRGLVGTSRILSSPASSGSTADAFPCRWRRPSTGPCRRR